MKKWILISTLTVLLAGSKSLYGSICGDAKQVKICCRSANKENCTARRQQSILPSTDGSNETTGRSSVYYHGGSLSQAVSNGNGRIVR